MVPLMEAVDVVAEREEKRRVGAGRVDTNRYGLRPTKNGHHNHLAAGLLPTRAQEESRQLAFSPLIAGGHKSFIPRQLASSSSKSTSTMASAPTNARILTSARKAMAESDHSLGSVPGQVRALYSIAEQDEEASSLVSSTFNDINKKSCSQRRRRGLCTAALYLASLSLISALTFSQQQQVYDNRYRMGGAGNDMLSAARGPQIRPPNRAADDTYAAPRNNGPGRGGSSQGAQVWSSRALVSQYGDDPRALPDDREPGAQLIVRRTTAANNNGNNNNNRPLGPQNVMKSVRHIVSMPAAQGRSDNTSAATTSLYRPADTSIADSPTPSALDAPSPSDASQPDACSDRLCYGLPEGCLVGVTSGSLFTAPSAFTNLSDSSQATSPLCKAMVTAKRFIDPSRPVSRDILFELIGLPQPGYKANYVAVGFSETGRMAGLVTECVQFRDPKSSMQVIDLKHSYNLPTIYKNVPVEIISGIKKLGVTYEGGYYQCRWIVESAVEFSYSLQGSADILTRREDLGYKSYHILLASGEYDISTDEKMIHDHRVSSIAPLSLAQTGHIKSLGPHILIRIHGSLMIVIWIGFTTLSIILARYYKNEWSNLKISDSALWFVVHRTLMLASWFGTLIAIIFAFMYTETYHPGIHQISGTTCLVLTSIQVLGGLLRPSQDSSKRVYFNWTHFLLGNLSYLCAMICLITAAFLAPAQLPPLYIWIMVIFVATYALTHIAMTLHQYIVHKSSSKLSPIDDLWLQTFIRPPLTHLENSHQTRKEISITPVNESNGSSINGKNHHNKLTSNGHIAGLSHSRDSSSPFRQFIMGIFVTVIVIFIVLLISLVNIK